MNLRAVFSHRSFSLMLAFLIVQQLVVASSSLWIINFIHNIQTGSSFYMNLCLYLASLLIPFIPGSWAVIYQEKWKLDLTLTLSDTFKGKFKTEQKIWSDNNSKEMRLSILSSEGMNVMFDFAEYAYSLISTLINAVFNITILSILINIDFGIGYLISLLAVGCCIRLLKNKQERLTEKAQNTRIGFIKILLHAWDNVVLGNQYNFDLWDKKLSKRSSSYVFRDLSAKRFRQWSSVVIAFLTFAPCFFAVILSISANASNPLVLGAIAVTLPRLFLILNYTYELLTQLFNWPYQKSMLSKIDQMLCSPPPPQSLSDRISWEKIKYTHYNGADGQPSDFLPLSNIDDLVNKTNLPGRITIRGENGSGKTTLLLMLKDMLKDRAFFLPSKHNLTFRRNLHTSSSGQGIKLALEEIRDYVGAKVILLDEWDANLDNANQSSLSGLINEFAQKYCVIEVRHRS